MDSTFYSRLILQIQLTTIWIKRRCSCIKIVKLPLTPRTPKTATRFLLKPTDSPRLRTVTSHLATRKTRHQAILFEIGFITVWLLGFLLKKWVVAISVISSTLNLPSAVSCSKSLQGRYLMGAVMIFIRGRRGSSMHLLDWLIVFIIQA